MVTKSYAPNTRKQGKIVDDINELVSVIRNVPGVI